MSSNTIPLPLRKLYGHYGTYSEKGRQREGGEKGRGKGGGREGRDGGRGRRREKKKSGIGLIANVCSCDGFTLILRAQTRALRGSRYEARSCRNRITRSLGHSDTEDRDWNYAHTYVE